MALVIGIDPGTGVTSPAGLVVFDTETRIIYEAAQITTTTRIHHRVISTVAAQLGAFIQRAADKERKTLVCHEDFVMRGKGGVTLQRLIGAIFTHIPKEGFDVESVYNTRVKMFTGGDGASDKAKVAAGVLKYFEKNLDSFKTVRAWINAGLWDLTDAAAIGIAGWMQREEKSVTKKQIKKTIDVC